MGVFRLRERLRAVVVGLALGTFTVPALASSSSPKPAPLKVVRKKRVPPPVVLKGKLVARIVDMKASEKGTQLTLDKGRSHGVEKGARAVFGGQYSHLSFRVRAVTDRTAIVDVALSI